MTPVKLEGIYNNTIYASRCSSLHAEYGDLKFYRHCTLPIAVHCSKSFRRIFQTKCLPKKIITRLTGPFPTTNFWQNNEDIFYATRGNCLFRSDDLGRSWSNILQLPSSSGPMGILPSGFCVDGSTLFLGEYPLDESEQPSLLQSTDGGDTWSILTKPHARHIHSIKQDPYSSEIWVTTGDTNKESMIARLSGEELNVIGGGKQLWRAVEMVFTPEAILWGMDCPYADQNQILRLPRDEIGLDNPTLDRLHSVSSPIYYADSLERNGEHHVFFSTAIEPATRPKQCALVLHGSTEDGFKTWETVAEYSRNKSPLDRYFNTNTYIFIATDEERGLFYNPYNTDTDHGQIKNVPISQIRNSLG